MSISSKHPNYAEYKPDWDKLRDAYRGERIVKEQGLEYLPATSGMLMDGMESGQDGYKAYLAYKLRARFPGFLGQAVEALLGIMHHKPPTIELPEKMEPLRESATVHGESLENLLRKINENQLVSGRIGLLADVQSGAAAGVLPYIAPYVAHDIINWDDGERDAPVKQTLNLVVLDESEQVRHDIFEWSKEQKYRVLAYGDIGANESDTPSQAYRMGVFGDDEEFNESAMFEPSIAGRKLDQIPFVFVNTKDIVADPDTPPLLGLAELAFAVYRSEADYRQSLFMQGQDTLVIIGGIDTDNDVRAGAGARISVQQGGDAKYVGVDSSGLPEQRMAIDNDRKEAADIGGKLLDTTGRDAESGDALRIRVSARTASLNQIAYTGAAGLQAILRIMAEWVGANPEQVVVTPNTDFTDDSIDGRTLVDVMSAKALGLPLSKQSVHEMLQDRGYTQMKFDEEMALIEKEQADDLDGGDGTGEGGDPSLDDDGQSGE